VLNSSYRNPLTFGDDVIAQAERALERLRIAVRPAATPVSATPGNPEAEEALKRQIEATRQSFIDCMDDDFNTAGALGYLFELVRVINQARDSGIDPAVLQSGQNLLRELTGVFGLHMERPNFEGNQASPFIAFLIELRSELRKQKNWALSDQIRNRLAELNVLLEDGKDGTSWRWK
jgi:cysteinyl-tRNA synthetase